MLTAGQYVNSVEASLADIRRLVDETGRRLDEQGRMLAQQAEKLDKIGDVLVHIARQDERHRALRQDVERLEERVDDVDSRVDALEHKQVAASTFGWILNRWFWRIVVPIGMAMIGFMWERIWSLVGSS